MLVVVEMVVVGEAVKNRKSLTLVRARTARLQKYLTSEMMLTHLVDADEKTSIL